MEECMDVAPHSDDWPGYEATAAQTAVSVLYAALEYLREPIIEFLARAAMDAIDNADYIDEYSKPRPHKFTFVYPGQDPLPESPLAVAELKRQLRDAAILTDSNVSEDDRVDGIWQLTDRGERIEKPFVI